MQPASVFRIELPAWAVAFAGTLPVRLESDTERMRAAIELSRRNSEAGTGGPFGALVVVSATGEVISLGVNRVEPEHCSSAHAEIVALSLAQRRIAHWNLAEALQGPLELVSSCEPCAMCLGAIPWSGVRRLVCGAARADAEAAGFDEGERPSDWTGVLNRRGIEVATGILQAHAAAILKQYAESGSTIYNP